MFDIPIVVFIVSWFFFVIKSTSHSTKLLAGELLAYANTLRTYIPQLQTQKWFQEVFLYKKYANTIFYLLKYCPLDRKIKVVTDYKR